MAVQLANQERPHQDPSIETIVVPDEEDGDRPSDLEAAERRTADPERRSSDSEATVNRPAETETDESQTEATERHPAEGDPSSSSDENQCGVVYCYKKFLNLLPVMIEEEEDEEASEAALRFGARQVIMLIVPVTICMALVVLSEISIPLQNSGSGGYTLFSESSASNDGLVLLIAIGNAVIVVVLVIVMTTVLVCLFKYRCYRAIQAWLLVASASLLFIFSALYAGDAVTVYNVAVDWPTLAFVIWNFGVMGLLVIHWKGPLRLQQAYLVLVCAIAATRLLRYLPKWTTWVLLVAISIYDLFAVLCPKGPLRVLVNIAKERNENIFPSLIYSSTVLWILGMADKDDKDDKTDKGGASSRSVPATDSVSVSQHQQAARGMGQARPSPDERASRGRRREGEGEGEGGEQEDRSDEEPRGFKLGLGDFIFYSILMGRATHDSQGDWVIISSCFVAILIGLCLTSLILGVVKRALPALPFSIFFGVMFYLSSLYVISPMFEVLSSTQTFI